MSNFKLLRISSNDRNSNTSTDHNGNFSVSITSKYFLQRVKSISTIAVWIPNNRSNINSTNNKLIITEFGQPQATITFDEGQYILSELITELKNKIDAALVGGTVSIAEDIKTKKLTFTYTVATIMNSISTIAPIIGLINTTPSQLISVMDSIPNLSGDQMLYIHSQALSRSYTLDAKDGTISSFTHVDFSNTPFGTTGYREVNILEQNKIIYRKPLNISTIKIVCRDINGNIVNPGSGIITLLLHVEYVPLA